MISKTFFREALSSVRALLFSKGKGYQYLWLVFYLVLHIMSVNSVHEGKWWTMAIDPAKAALCQQLCS